jgi:hypothetical protein
MAAQLHAQPGGSDIGVTIGDFASASDTYCTHCTSSNSSTASTDPHQGVANGQPLRPLPTPVTDLDETTPLRVRRRDHLGIPHEYKHAA